MQMPNKPNKQRIFTSLETDEVLSKTLKDRLNPLISQRTGLINAILKRNEYSQYGLSAYQCLSCQTKVLTGHSRSATSGGFGFHKKPEIALASCIYEALERYCLAFKLADSVTVTTHELPIEYRPNRMDLYTKKQYQNSIYSDPEDSPVEWVKAKGYQDRHKEIYWPASLVYIPYEESHPVAETTSTGVAANDDIDAAFISGLCENIERDAIMINTMRTLHPPSIMIDTITGESSEFIRQLKNTFNIRIHRLYSDVDIPIYLSFIWNTLPGGLHYGIGACANFSSDYAIYKSLKECLFTYTYSMDMLDMRVSNPMDIKGLHEHFLFYQSDEFWNLPFDDSKIEIYVEKNITLNEVLASLRRSGIDAYYIDLTTPDIKPSGIKVIRAITPGLIDLNKRHDMPRLAAERYWTVPDSLGLRGSPKLLELPHPFP